MVNRPGGEIKVIKLFNQLIKGFIEGLFPQTLRQSPPGGARSPMVILSSKQSLSFIMNRRSRLRRALLAMAPKPKRRQWTPAKDTLVVNGVAVEWSLSKDGMVQYGAKVDGKRPTFTLRKVETEADAPRRVREALRPRDADNGVDAADGPDGDGDDDGGPSDCGAAGGNAVGGGAAGDTGDGKTVRTAADGAAASAAASDERADEPSVSKAVSGDAYGSSSPGSRAAAATFELPATQVMDDEDDTPALDARCPSPEHMMDLDAADGADGADGDGGADGAGAADAADPNAADAAASECSECSEHAEPPSERVQPSGQEVRRFTVVFSELLSCRDRASGEVVFWARVPQERSYKGASSTHGTIVCAAVLRHLDLEPTRHRSQRWARCIC